MVLGGSENSDEEAAILPEISNKTSHGTCRSSLVLLFIIVMGFMLKGQKTQAGPIEYSNQLGVTKNLNIEIEASCGVRKTMICKLSHLCETEADLGVRSDSIVEDSPLPTNQRELFKHHHLWPGIDKLPIIATMSKGPIGVGIVPGYGLAIATVQANAEYKNSIIVPEYGLAVAEGKYPVGWRFCSERRCSGKNGQT